jgi:hypothetical protein
MGLDLFPTLLSQGPSQIVDASQSAARQNFVAPRRRGLQPSATARAIWAYAFEAALSIIG